MRVSLSALIASRNRTFLARHYGIYFNVGILSPKLAGNIEVNEERYCPDGRPLSSDKVP